MYYKAFIDWVLRQTLTKHTIVYYSSKYVTKKLSFTMEKKTIGTIPKTTDI